MTDLVHEPSKRGIYHSAIFSEPKESLTMTRSSSGGATEKPHLGKIENWWKWPATDKGLGYMICGLFVDHPRLAGQTGHTSYEVAHHEATNEIETRNSRYSLGNPAALTRSPS